MISFASITLLYEITINNTSSKDSSNKARYIKKSETIQILKHPLTKIYNSAIFDSLEELESCLIHEDYYSNSSSASNVKVYESDDHEQDLYFVMIQDPEIIRHCSTTLNIAPTSKVPLVITQKLNKMVQSKITSVILTLASNSNSNSNNELIIKSLENLSQEWIIHSNTWNTTSILTRLVYSNEELDFWNYTTHQEERLTHDVSTPVANTTVHAALEAKLLMEKMQILTFSEKDMNLSDIFQSSSSDSTAPTTAPSFSGFDAPHTASTAIVPSSSSLSATLLKPRKLIKPQSTNAIRQKREAFLRRQRHHNNTTSAIPPPPPPPPPPTSSKNAIMPHNIIPVKEISAKIKNNTLEPEAANTTTTTLFDPFSSSTKSIIQQTLPQEQFFPNTTEPIPKQQHNSAPTLLLKSKLIANLAIQEELNCAYTKSKLSSSSVEGVLQLQMKTLDVSTCPETPPLIQLQINDPRQQIHTILENRNVLQKKTESSKFIIELPKYNHYIPILKYNCQKLRPVPIRVQSRLKFVKEEFIRIALQISSNPANSEKLSDLSILLHISPQNKLKIETLITSPEGGIWIESKRCVVWCVSELGCGEKFHLQAQFQIEDFNNINHTTTTNTTTTTTATNDKEQYIFPVEVRAQCLFAQLSDIDFEIDHFNTEKKHQEEDDFIVDCQLARRFKLSHVEKS